MITLDVDTDGGGSYSSASAAEAALPASPTDDYTVTLEGATDDTTAVTVDGTGFSYGGYTCTWNPISADLHNGVWDTSKYLLTNATSDTLTIRDDGHYFVGFQIGNTNAGSRMLVNVPLSVETYLVNIYGTNNNNGSSENGFFVSGSGAHLHAHGNIIEDCYNAGMYLNNGQITAEGNLVNNCGTGYVCVATEVFQLTNSIGINCTAFGSGAFTSSGYNFTDLSSMGYTGGSNDTTDIVIADNFTDAANGDFTVKDTGADIYHAGTTLSYLTNDIAGTAYDSPPSAGPFEYVSSGASVTASVSESGDSTTAAIDVLLQISASQAETGDTSAATLEALVQLSAALSEAGDTTAAAIIAELTSSITASQTENGDATAAVLNVLSQISANQSEIGDSTSATLDVLINLTAALAEAGDTTAASILTVATASIVASQAEGGDSTTAALNALIQIQAAQSEAGDAAAAALNVLAQIVASQAEAGDTTAAQLQVLINITASIAETGDTTAASLLTVLTSFITASQAEAGDTTSASINVAPIAGVAMAQPDTPKRRRHPRGWEPFDISYFRTKYQILEAKKRRNRPQIESTETIQADDETITPEQIDDDIERINAIAERLDRQRKDLLDQQLRYKVEGATQPLELAERINDLDQLAVQAQEAVDLARTVKQRLMNNTAVVVAAMTYYFPIQ